MILPDVNVLIYAFREETPDHAAYASWLDDVVRGSRRFGMSEGVLSGFLRLVTNRRVYAVPAPLGNALAFVDRILAAPACERVRPGPRHWGIFVDLCQAARVEGGGVSDAYHAALAIETGSVWITADRGFARFPGLHWRQPLSS